VFSRGFIKPEGTQRETSPTSHALNIHNPLSDITVQRASAAWKETLSSELKSSSLRNGIRQYGSAHRFSPMIALSRRDRGIHYRSMANRGIGVETATLRGRPFHFSCRGRASERCIAPLRAWSSVAQATLRGRAATKPRSNIPKQSFIPGLGATLSLSSVSLRLG